MDVFPTLAELAERKLEILREGRAAIRPVVRHILAAERHRDGLARIETLAPAHACRLILREWRRTFGKPARPGLPEQFVPGDYASHPSVRMIRSERSSARRMGHAMRFEENF